MPDVSPRHLSPGHMTEWMEIYRNVRVQPDRYSIYHLAGIKPEQVAAFEDTGIRTIEQIPDDADLIPRQARQVAVAKFNKRLIQRDEIERFLAELKHPLYFLDYETFLDVMPPFDGIRPYQQIPFQYSLHIITEPGAPVQHREYLHAESSNPVAALISQLRADIGDKGSVIVWYAPFETGRNQEMAAMVPPDAAFLTDLNDRIVDLMVPFQAGWFVDKDFFGSASIKKVLPVLVPDLSYDGLVRACHTSWLPRVVQNLGGRNRRRPRHRQRSGPGPQDPGEGAGGLPAVPVLRSTPGTDGRLGEACGRQRSELTGELGLVKRTTNAQVTEICRTSIGQPFRVPPGSGRTAIRRPRHSLPVLLGVTVAQR